jgi:hypothetical protein
MTGRSEKDAVYAELRALRRRVLAQRNELTALRLSSTAKAAAIERDKAASYRKALSNIAYRLDNGGIADAELRSIVTRALLGKGLRTKAARRQFRRSLKDSANGAAKAAETGSAA